MSDADDRREMIEILAGLGVDEADVPQSLSDGAAIASDVVLARGDAHSLRDIAAQTGIPVDQVAENFLHLGIHAHSPDEVMFNDDDVALAAFLQQAIQEILTEDEGQEFLHVAGTALSTIAEAAVAGHVQGPESRTRSYVENARLNASTAELGLQLSRHLAVAFRHHLRQSSHSNRNTQNYDNRALVTLTVGFLDLVGFTSLSQELSIDALVDLVKGFENHAHELAHEHHARIVKLIGDEVMIVAEKPDDAARFVAGMIASLDADSVVPRGGLAHGDLVNIHGDFFGPVVNLAARLTDAAVPGEVLVDDAVAAHVTVEAAGRRMLKGFDEPIRVHTLVADRSQ
jgi:adenylate cyclase